MKEIENVWDYPRPPRLEKVDFNVKVYFNNVKIADSVNTYRVLETSHPPVYYIPIEDIRKEFLKVTDYTSFCEFKGNAGYYDLEVNDKKVSNAGWYYPSPVKEYELIKNYVAFYPQKMDECYIDDEKVIHQKGNFYGGWITENIVGPFKGHAGTESW